MEIISDDRLAMVAGGAGTGPKTITLCVPLPEGAGDDLNIRVYVNGVLDRSKSMTVSCGTKSVRFTFRGNGPAEIMVKVNNLYVRTYYVNFDTQGN